MYNTITQSELSGNQQFVLDQLDEILKQYAKNDSRMTVWYFVRDILSLARSGQCSQIEYGRTVAKLSENDVELSPSVLDAFLDDAVEAYEETLCTDPTTRFCFFIPEYVPEGQLSPWQKLIATALVEKYLCANATCDPRLLLTQCWRSMPQQLRRCSEIVNVMCRQFALPELGTVVPGRYQLEGLINIGGMGVVYRAFHEDLQAYVALKMMRPDCENATLFIAEGRATVKMQDDRFVAVRHAHLTGHERPQFFTMDLVEGGRSFGDLLDRIECFDQQELGSIKSALHLPPGIYGFNSPIQGVNGRSQFGGKIWRTITGRSHQRHQESFFAAVLARVAQAIGDLHRKGYIHSDLKPENILICPRRGPVIADLGLCRPLVNGVADATEFMGTVAYACPEQVAGRAMTPQSDVFQLGGILYRCLTGKAPFGRQSPEEKPADMLSRAEKGAYPPLSKVAPGLNRELVAICQKAMASAPENRYDSAQALAQDLDRFKNGVPARARSGYKFRTFFRSMTRSAMIWVFVTLLVICGFWGWNAWLLSEDIPGCIASQNRFRARSTVPTPDVQIDHRPTWEVPNYDPFIFLTSSSCFDLSEWRALDSGANPASAGRIEEARLTDVFELKRKRSDLSENGKIQFQFRTEGYDVDYRCVTHPFTVRGSPTNEVLGGGTSPVKIREINIDLSREPLETPFRIVIHASIWNGFQCKPEGKQWIGFIGKKGRLQDEMALKLPVARKLVQLPRLYIFEKGTAQLNVPTETQNFFASADREKFVWRVTEIRPNFVYKMEWEWKP